MQRKKVILLVDTRKMRCMNPDCSHKTFSEKHPFVTAKSKKTNRLIQNILYTSSQLSSLNASKLLKSENISVCKSSICDLLKKMPSIVDKSSVKMVCVDDFALRKRFSYGTVMINLENHRIVDIEIQMMSATGWKSFTISKLFQGMEPSRTHPPLQILILISHRSVTGFTW